MKFKTLLLTAMMSLALAACDDKSKNSTPPSVPDIQKQAPEVKKVSSEEAVKINIEKNTFNFTTGKETNDYSKKLFVFFDPQCPHCSTLWKNLQDESLKDFNVVWIPVAVLNEKSVPQAASILSASNPVALFSEHEALISQNKIDEANQKLAALEKSNTKEINEKIAKNTKVFLSTGASGVPLTLKLSNNKERLLGAPGELSVTLLKNLVNEQNEFAQK